ncbi:MAG TPA: ATP-binding protein, partial [Candidatus Nanoarchaeia archaeon]|nr:ATP-binding protein [Candidatus Nanoarchaeia archaeon]
YSQEANPFTDEEVKLLTELANDFAYGITMLKLKQEKLHAEEEQRINVCFLRLLNQAKTTGDLVRSVTSFLMEQSKCEAVGIRLEKNDDYPYYETKGFPLRHVQLENQLCARDDQGNILRDDKHDPVLECMCGNIIKRRFDSSKPFFTQKGSFWTNSTTDLLATSTEKDRQVRTRNRCNGEGYESVALIALHAGNRQLGLIQFNDKRKGMFTLNAIQQWETLADHLSLALAKALAENEVRQQAALIDLSPDAIIVRHPEGKIIQWSKGAEKLYGYSKEEAAGQSTHKILQTVFHEPIQEILIELKTKGYWTGELVHQSKSGQKIIVQSYWLPTIDEEGKITELMESNVDITERKEMQNKLEEYAAHLEELVQERTQQLKDSERLTAIGETAGMVGHDLRNPLQTITGETYLAKKELSKLPENEARANLQESIDTIAEQVGYMDKIVSDLQDFVRPIKPDKKPQNISKLLNATVANVKIPINIEVETKISQNLPEISVDGQLLKRVFINLVTNAVQAMSHGGTITISTEMQKAPNGTQKILVHVKDSGEGIPDDIRTKIFRPLFTTKSKGQGFGLAVCKRVIEAHGGAITLKSQVGEGSTFTVELPV